MAAVTICSDSAIKRNAFESVLMRWMNLEPIMQSEVGQKEKNIICEHTYIEPRKMVLMSLLAGQQWRYRQRKLTVDTVGEGERGTN